MITVAQLIERLRDFPQDIPVCVFDNYHDMAYAKFFDADSVIYPDEFIPVSNGLASCAVVIEI